MRRADILSIALLLLPGFSGEAQVSRRDLDDIERHRRQETPAPVLQSIGNDSLSWNVTVKIQSWEFLEGGDPDVGSIPEEDRLQGDMVHNGATVVLPDFWEKPDTLLAAMVADYIARHRRGLSTVLGRYESYRDELRMVFRRRSLPESLTLLAAVESAMNPLALSKAGARGMWQFMPGTARSYGLRCDEIVDERLDYLSSADAAAAYLEKAYNKYGDWRLAISSYNCGSGAVEKAIRRAQSKDYWKIYPFLPEETRGYFPAFAASLYAYLYREDLGITLAGFSRETGPLIRVDRSVTFKELASETGVDVRELRRLNPQFLTGIVPGGNRAYHLRIPKRKFSDREDNRPMKEIEILPESIFRGGKLGGNRL